MQLEVGLGIKNKATLRRSGWLLAKAGMLIERWQQNLADTGLARSGAHGERQCGRIS